MDSYLLRIIIIIILFNYYLETRPIGAVHSTLQYHVSYKAPLRD